MGPTWVRVGSELGQSYFSMVFRAISPANACQKLNMTSPANACLKLARNLVIWGHPAIVATCQNIHSDCRYTPQVQQRISLPVRALRVQSDTAKFAASQSPEWQRVIQRSSLPARAWGPAPSANIASFNSCLASIASYICACSEIPLPSRFML